MIKEESIKLKLTETFYFHLIQNNINRNFLELLPLSIEQRTELTAFPISLSQ